MPKRVSDTEIKARICATRLRWPESSTTIAWRRLHECVDALHGLLQTVDHACAEAEQNADFSSSGIARRRTELGRQALNEMVQFKPFLAAERAVTNDIDLIEKRMTDLPQPPIHVAEVALAQEIRQHLRRQKRPIDLVLKLMSDPRILSAILSAPAFLSGLSEIELNLVRERARTALHPEQVETQAKLSGALEELRLGVAATRRLLLERTETREDDDGQFRSTREPPPRGGRTPVALPAATSEEAPQ